MIHSFSGRTADEIWLKIADVFRTKDGVTEQLSRAGMTLELLHCAFSVSEPCQRWVVSRELPMNLAFALVDVVWVITGREDSRFLNYFSNRLPEFAGRGERYHGAYGYRLRRHLGIDQLERAYQALKSNPQTRQVVLQIWDSRIDLPQPGGEPASEDIPCNVLSILKVRDGALEWFQVMRSNDLYLGLPHNLVQFTTLQEVLAGWLGLRIGSYNHASDSVHVYEKDVEHVLESRPIKGLMNTDSFILKKSESELCFVELAGLIEKVIDDANSADSLLTMTVRCRLPEAFRNALAVISAEGARRRGYADLSDEIVGQCSNPVYRQMCERWCDRVNGVRKTQDGM